LAQHWASDHSEFGLGATTHVTAPRRAGDDGAPAGDVWARTWPSWNTSKAATASAKALPAAIRQKAQTSADAEITLAAKRRERQGNGPSPVSGAAHDGEFIGSRQSTLYRRSRRGGARRHNIHPNIVVM